VTLTAAQYFFFFFWIERSLSHTAFHPMGFQGPVRGTLRWVWGPLASPAASQGLRHAVAGNGGDHRCAPPQCCNVEGLDRRWSEAAVGTFATSENVTLETVSDVRAMPFSCI
jgi:hypothetical protein